MNIQTKKDLQPLSTFGLKAYSHYYLEISDDAELLEVSDFISELRIPSLTIGGGSNMIFCSNYPGVVIKSKIESIEQNSTTKVTVSSGMSWDEFVLWSISKDLSGVEALSGIPGTVGGAVALNAGAYGQSVKETLQSVRVYDITTRKLRSYATDELHYWHRSSIFREKRGNDWVIIDATFKLRRSMSHPTHPKIISLPEQSLQSPDALRRAVLGLRSFFPNPYKVQNSGSFFLNPTITNAQANKLKEVFPGIVVRAFDKKHQQISSGWLLDTAGLKGTRIGNFSFSKRHANLVINNASDSSGKDLLQFITHASKIVKYKFGINLVPEPLLVGEEFWQGMLKTLPLKIS